MNPFASKLSPVLSGGIQSWNSGYGAQVSGSPRSFFGSQAAGCFCPTGELGQDQSLGGISSLMQGLMMTTMMMQMMTMMQMLQSMVSGNSAAPTNANFGSRAGGTPSLGGDSSGASAGSSTGSAAGGSVASKNKTGKIVDVPGGRLDSAIAGAVVAMMDAAKKDGVNLKISSSYRSRQEQEVLYAKYKNGTGNLAAKPGTSNHESGLAIDFQNTTGAYSWLAKNAGRFGLKNLPGEPWHYSPTGT